VSATPEASRYRWLVLAVFVLSTAINYLDRATLAALFPTLRAEFHLTNTQIGWIGSAFNIAYAASAPFAGILIDTVGLNAAISAAVAVWSCAGIATGFTSGLAGLVGCRTVLGAAEAAGIPAAGKAIHRYLAPAERALGNAVNQAGVSLGSILAPPLAVGIAVRSGWRAAFLVTGALGLLWIPAWNWAARRATSGPAAKLPAGAGADLLADPRLWAFVAANALNMAGYYLWFNWTTLYLVDVQHLTQAQSAWYAWIPPLFAGLGGVSGGWLSWRFVARGIPAPAARFRVCLAAAVMALLGLALPLAPNAAWASAGISAAIFAVAAFSVNIYTLPLDVFGGARAAFAVSMLVASYGAVTAVLSPVIGAVIDAHGYTPATTAVAFTPLLACAVLFRVETLRERTIP